MVDILPGNSTDAMDVVLDEVTPRAGAWFLLHVRTFASLHLLVCDFGAYPSDRHACSAPDPMAEDSQAP